MDSPHLDDWRHYPFVLAEPAFRFPDAEGLHPKYESDTWFLAGELTGQGSGRKFAFLTIFNKNRPGGTMVADFYTFALFDLDDGDYGTYTDYDMPPASMREGAQAKLSAAVGHLDMSYGSGAGPAVWRARRDDDGRLLPYTYEVGLVGRDQSGQAMELGLDVSPTRAPVLVGGSAYNGKIECFGQEDTYSYFQTGMTMAGTLRWGALDEGVSGSAGHIDRQWFPTYAGAVPRERSHEWRTINLDNGVDLSIWRQFDRTNRNALQPFSGATTSDGECAEDIEVDVQSYVRWPDSVAPLVPPPTEVRYMPDRHRLTSKVLELDLVGQPLVAAPAHALPIEYMEGPYRYHGTMRGQRVSGFAFNERSLALYRDWELVDVMAAAVENLRPRPDELMTGVATLRSLVVAGRRQDALDHLGTAIRPVVDGLDSVAELRPILDDVANALSAES